MKFSNDYDIFEVGEIWYLIKSDDIYCGENYDELKHFDEGAELEILGIEKETGYGKAIVEINGNHTLLRLDELYDMVMD